jgi:adenosine deaminase
MKLDQDLIHQLPKSELHLHLEGSTSLERFLYFGKIYRTGIASLSLSEIRQAHFEFRNFHHFLDSYGLICRHLRCPEDYVEVLKDLETYLIQQNILYCEVIYTPSIPWKFGSDGREVLLVLLDEAKSFEEKTGRRIRWILDNVRQWGIESAERTVQLANDFRENGVVGVGLGGDENSVPLKDFSEIFGWAKANQLFVHIHAGEIGGPEEVWEALQIAGANRIGHGIQSSRDPKLITYLKEHAIGLDICLTSNLKTKAWPLLSDHPFQMLYRRGVPVTLNTDDPGMFETTLCQEYQKAVKAYDLTLEDIQHLILQAVRSAFLPHEDKMSLMQTFQKQFQSITKSL